MPVRPAAETTSSIISRPRFISSAVWGMLLWVVVTVAVEPAALVAGFGVAVASSFPQVPLALA